MLARLLLALLLAAFAMPAAAATACHEPARSHHAMPGMPDMPEQKLAPTHACIGCIPPGDWTARGIATPVWLLAPAPVAPIARIDVLGGTPPATPPPRLG